MPPKSKPKASKRPTYNKAKNARRSFKPKTTKYKSDHQEAICTSFVDTVAAITDAPVGASGALANINPLGKNTDIVIAACIPLSPNTNILASHRHASLKNMFNEWNTSAVYLDLLFSPELRANCDQVFMLVERGITGTIADEKTMVSDVNCRMYQLGNNTQKLTFKHIFNTAQDKINKKSTDVGVQVQDTYFLKILCKGKNVSQQALEAGDCQIKLRAKCYNKYRDMKALTSDLN